MAEENHTMQGFRSGWLQRFFWQPFDPLCIMLAMRTKLLLDAIDELGHSYNLMRILVNRADVPIPIVPPIEPPGGNPTVPPYVYPPGPPYVPPGGGGGGGGGDWNPTPPPPGYGGYPPGSGGGGPGCHGGGAWVCCMMPYPPATSVTIGYTTLEMNCGESQELTIEGAYPTCGLDTYTWELVPVQGSIVPGSFSAIYTAPAGGGDCSPSQKINLYCYDALIASITITIASEPVSATIAYTSLQMQKNEEQELVAVASGEFCSGDAFSWAIVAGGGSLSAETGEHVVYTAPATNENCANNPTITLSFGAIVLDSISLAINAYTGATAAWKRTKACKNGCQVANGQTICMIGCTSIPGYYCCACASFRYKCSNVYLDMADSSGSSSTSLSNCEAAWPVWCGADPATVDLRTSLMKTQGCCPAGLL